MKKLRGKVRKHVRKSWSDKREWSCELDYKQGKQENKGEIQKKGYREEVDNGRKEKGENKEKEEWLGRDGMC